MDSALSAKLELEAKLGSVADERKALLERCLAAESELDRDQRIRTFQLFNRFLNRIGTKVSRAKRRFCQEAKTN